MNAGTENFNIDIKLKTVSSNPYMSFKLKIASSVFQQYILFPSGEQWKTELGNKTEVHGIKSLNFPVML